MTVGVRAAGARTRLPVVIPEDAFRPVDLLPVLREIDDTLIEHASAAAADDGQPVSCRAGCDACCHQLVPVTPDEAHALARLVDDLPDERRAVVRQRFADAVSTLERHGLRTAVASAPHGEPGDRRAVASRYFALGIACPFLDQGRCSIYDERPMACREYLVTSPAEDCVAGAARRLAVPGRLLPRLLEADRERHWVPLVLLPSLTAAAHDATEDVTTSPALLARTLGVARPTRRTYRLGTTA